MSSTDKLIDFATKNIQDAINAAEKFLPTATKHVLQITSLNCVMNLLPLVYLIPLLVVFFVISWKLFIKIKDTKIYDKEFAWFLWGLGSFVLGGIIITAVLALTLNGWNWVCIFRPDLYLVHLAVQKVLGQ